MGSKYDKEPCCGISLLKYVLFIFNFFLLIGGAGVLGVGIWTVISKFDYTEVLCSHAYIISTYALIISGGVVIIVAATGCYGAVQEVKGCLLLYFTLLLLLCLIELGVGVFVYYYRGELQVELEKCMNSSMTKNYGLDGNSAYTATVDDLQNSFNCCGAASFEDWTKSEWKINGLAGNRSVPESCCKTISPYCSIRTHPSNIYQQGCVVGLSLIVEDHLIIIGAVSLAIAGAEIMGLIFSMCLYCHLRYEEQEPY
ncbi:CD151 antigen-like [Lytechinus pictus]|uniref:CD151 antigen-like n=1 Tax=Lytechinus pictus TaxID=7653 RepID=UPI0030B9FD0C